MDFKHIGLTKTASELQPLTVGPQVQAKYQTMERHPTETIGSAAFAVNQERRALQQMSVMYGSHMAMRTVIERSIMAQAQRPYGRSNHFGLNTDMGKYHTMDFADVLSDPYEQPQMDKEQIYSKMTKIYGL